MSKTVAYVAAAVVFLGIGSLVTGLIIWYHHPNLKKEEVINESRYGQCNLKSTGVDGNVKGTLYFEQQTPISPVIIRGNITGLAAGEHGFHVHQWGVSGASQDCKDAGGHYNPYNKKHSAPNSKDRHVGDLGNVEAKVDGINTDGTISQIDIKDNILQMYGQYSIVGRAIVVHEGKDDLGKGGNPTSLTTGNAGGRVACCTIYFTREPSQ